MRKKFRFWVEQRSQRCANSFQTNLGFSPRGTCIIFILQMLRVRGNKARNSCPAPNGAG
jgi:hypothetical protein